MARNSKKQIIRGGSAKALETLQSIIRDVGDHINPRPVENIVAEDLEMHIRPGKPSVLYIAPRYDYGDETRGLSFEHHNFYQSLRNMDVGTIYFDYDRLRTKYGDEKMGDILREVAYYYAPDYLLYFHFHDWVPHHVWRDISEQLPTKTVIWLSDDHWRYEDTEPVWRLFDLITTTDCKGMQRRTEAGYKNVHLTQWACNHHAIHNYHMNRDIDVAFIGQPYGERREFVNHLRQSGIQVATFGQGWEEGGRVSQGEMIGILNRGKIILDLSKASKGVEPQIKGRVFEATGAGGLLMTQNTPFIQEYFRPGEEILVYEDMADCAIKIAAILKDETTRQKIAEAGYRRTMADHTFDSRFMKIFSAADGISKSRL